MDVNKIRSLALQILNEIDIAGAQPRSASASAPPSGSTGTFPNYGKNKGGAIAGASERDLRFYAGGCLRSLGDPEKERWHAKERALLAAINDELQAQGFAPEVGEHIDPPAPAPVNDDDVPF